MTRKIMLHGKTDDSTGSLDIIMTLTTVDDAVLTNTPLQCVTDALSGGWNKAGNRLLTPNHLVALMCHNCVKHEDKL